MSQNKIIVNYVNYFRFNEFVNRQQVTSLADLYNKYDGFCHGLSILWAAQNLFGTIDMWESMLKEIAKPIFTEKENLDLAYANEKMSLFNKEVCLFNQRIYKFHDIFLPVINLINKYQNPEIDGKAVLQSYVLDPSKNIFDFAYRGNKVNIGNRINFTGDFSTNDLENLLLEQHLSENICLVHSGEHVIAAAYNRYLKVWQLYDPNYEHEREPSEKIHKSFKSKKDFVKAIRDELEGTLKIEISSFKKENILDRSQAIYMIDFYDSFDEFIHDEENIDLFKNILRLAQVDNDVSGCFFNKLHKSQFNPISLLSCLLNNESFDEIELYFLLISKNKNLCKQFEVGLLDQYDGGDYYIHWLADTPRAIASALNHIVSEDNIIGLLGAACPDTGALPLHFIASSSIDNFIKCFELAVSYKVVSSFFELLDYVNSDGQSVIDILANKNINGMSALQYMVEKYKDRKFSDFVTLISKLINYPRFIPLSGQNTIFMEINHRNNWEYAVMAKAHWYIASKNENYSSVKRTFSNSGMDPLTDQYKGETFIRRKLN